MILLYSKLLFNFSTKAYIVQKNEFKHIKYNTNNESVFRFCDKVICKNEKNKFVRKNC